MSDIVARTKHLIKKNEIVKTALVLVLVIGAEYLLILGLTSAFQTEYLPFHPVVSESMLPTIKVGDLIIVRGADPRSIAANDVIVFHNPRNRDMIIVHRVIQIIEKDGDRYFETKGDNNPISDNWSPYPGLPQRFLAGVVISVVPYVGYIILALKDPRGMTGIAILTVIVIIYEFILPLTKKKQASGRLDEQT